MKIERRIKPRKQNFISSFNKLFSLRFLFRLCYNQNANPKKGQDNQVKDICLRQLKKQPSTYSNRHFAFLDSLKVDWKASFLFYVFVEFSANKVILEIPL
jgi:hypothetical protein